MGRRNLSILFGVVVLALLWVGLAQAAEYSAVVVTKDKSTGREDQLKVYVKGDKTRYERLPDKTHITIFRPDKKVMWNLMTGQKTYMEMEASDSRKLAALFSMQSMKFPKKEGVEKKDKLKPVVTEMVNGYETEKRESIPGLPKIISWYSKKLKMVIKTDDDQKTMEYKNIKEGGVSDALFEIPAGYKKMAMPAGMPKMK